jgi:hypothetical protein
MFALYNFARMAFDASIRWLWESYVALQPTFRIIGELGAIALTWGKVILGVPISGYLGLVIFLIVKRRLWRSIKRWGIVHLIPMCFSATALLIASGWLALSVGCILGLIYISVSIRHDSQQAQAKTKQAYASSQRATKTVKAAKP